MEQNTEGKKCPECGKIMVKIQKTPITNVSEGGKMNTAIIDYWKCPNGHEEKV